MCVIHERRVNMSGGMNVNNDSTSVNAGFFTKMQERMQDFKKNQEALLKMSHELDGKYKSEATIIADFLYSQGGKDGKIPAEVWNNSDFADGRTKPIPVEEAIDTIYTQMLKESEERYLQKQQDELKKLEIERAQRALDEQVKNNPPKFGE